MLIPGRNRPSATLIAYFTERDQGQRKLWRLYRRGFRRTALAHKTAAGKAQLWDLFIWGRAVGVIFTTFLFLGLAGLVCLILPAAGLPVSDRVAIILILAGGLAGALSSGLWLRRSRYGVDRQLLEDHVRWLMTEETVLILQAPIETLRFAVDLLREGGHTSPAIFVLHPERAPVVDEARSPGTLLAPAQVLEHARRLAVDHQLAPRPHRNTVVLQRLQRARQGLHQVCADLSEASRLDQGVPATAEWLLDNEYVVETNARDVQLNLSRRFYLELPTLTSRAHQGLPRIYSLAHELVANTEFRLDRQNIEAFIEAYQTTQALTMGELWAFAQMLRVALIESLQRIAAQALNELREREIADLWTNRLISANRSDHNQLFSILAEFSKTQPSPSPYLATQLVDRLYDEEAALVPVQSWLERTYRQPMSELNLGEQNRQAKDQISVGNAFTSLRELAVLDWRQIFEHLSRVEQVLRQDPAGIYPRIDFGTRDRYRRAVQALTRASNHSEVQVAQRATELAAAAALKGGDDDRRRHVGTYLIGDSRPELARLIGGREAAGVSRSAMGLPLSFGRLPGWSCPPQHRAHPPGRPPRFARTGLANSILDQPAPGHSRQPAGAGEPKLSCDAAAATGGAAQDGL